MTGLWLCRPLFHRERKIQKAVQFTWTVRFNFSGTDFQTQLTTGSPFKSGTGRCFERLFHH